MTEQNIRDAFELHAKNTGFTLKPDPLHEGEYKVGYGFTQWEMFKAGWIAAFKMILESEVDG